MAKYVLVSFKTCPWVQRAAIVLREKNVDFEFRHIEPDNRPDWFLAISPHKKVPVLRVDDRVSLFESNAIAEYLDETVWRCIGAPRLGAGGDHEREQDQHRRADQPRKCGHEQDGRDDQADDDERNAHRCHSSHWRE
jgi:glutathione S-transferase